MKKSLAISAFVFISSSFATGKVLEFEQIPTLVKTQNLAFKKSLAEQDSKEARTSHLGRSFLPDLNVEAAQETFTVGRNPRKTQPLWKAEASVNLYRGGVDKAEDSKRNAELTEAQVSSEATLRQETYKTQKAFLDFQYAKEKVAILKQHVELNEKNAKQALRRIQAGVASTTDKLEFEINKRKLEKELELATAEKEDLLRALRFLLSDNSIEDIKLQNHHAHEDLAKLKALPAEQTLEMKRLGAEAKIVHAEKDLLQGQALPAFDIYAGMEQKNQREEPELESAADRRENYMGVRFSWSLGEIYKSSAERNALGKKQIALDLEANSKTQELEVQQKSRFQNLEVLHKALHDSDEYNQLAKQYMAAVSGEYSRGVKNSLDMMSATEKYIDLLLKKALYLNRFYSLYYEQLALAAFL